MDIDMSRANDQKIVKMWSNDIIEKYKIQNHIEKVFHIMSILNRIVEFIHNRE